MDFPTSFQTVDIACLYDGWILMGRKKKDGGLWRLPGGFVDPDLDFSLEEAAVRELQEETQIGAPISEMLYRGSYRIDNSRYRDSEHKIMTALFEVNINARPVPVASDDLNRVMWRKLSKLMLKDVVPQHRMLIRRLRD